MKITIALDVPDQFISDALLNAELDASQGRTPIPLPAHSAIRTLIEDSSPVKIRVASVSLVWEGRTIEVEYPFL